MNRMAQILFPVFFALTYVLASLALILPTGIAITEDGVNFVGAARNLIAGNGLTSFGGGPMTIWPPLYIYSLALGGFIGIDPIDFAIVINAISAFTMMWVLSTVVLTVIQGILLRIFVHLSLFLSLPLLDVVSEVRTEPLFIALTVASLVCAARYLAFPRPWYFGAGAFFAGLSCVTRYHGIFLVAVWIFLLLWRHRAEAIRSLSLAVAFAIGAGLPLLIWVGRNLVINSPSVNVTVDEPLLDRSVDILQRGLLEIASWFLPIRLDASLRILVGIAILAGIFFVTGLLLYRLRRRDGIDRRLNNVTVIFWYSILYFAGSFAAAILTGVWGIHRYLYVLYPMVFILLGFSVENLGFLAPAGTSRRGVSWKMLATNARWALTALLLAWLVIPIDRAIYYGGQVHAGKPDYFHVPRYKSSELAHWLSGNPLKGAVFSNEPAFVYIRAGLRTNYTLTRVALDRLRTLPAVEASNGAFAFFTRVNRLVNYPNGPVFLVWLHENPRDDLARPDMLRTLLDIEIAIELADATIYRVRNRTPGDADERQAIH